MKHPLLAAGLAPIQRVQAKKNQVLSVKEAFLAPKNLKMNQKLAAVERGFQKPTHQVSQSLPSKKMSSLSEFNTPIQKISDANCSIEEELGDSWLAHGSEGATDTIDLTEGKQVLKIQNFSAILEMKELKKDLVDSKSTQETLASNQHLKFKSNQPRTKPHVVSEDLTPENAKAQSRDCKSMNELIGSKMPTASAHIVTQTKKNLMRLALGSSPDPLTNVVIKTPALSSCTSLAGQRQLRTFA